MPNRDRFLTIMLVLSTIVDIGVVLFLIFLALPRLFVLLPRWAAFSTLAIAAMRVLALVGIWRFNKSAAVLYLALALTSLLVGTLIARPLEPSVIGLIWAAVLLFAVVSNRQQFSCLQISRRE